MKDLFSEPPLVSWPCYEPAGHCVELTQSDLVQHILLVGSTGCGKTTLLASAVDQLVAHEAQSSAHKLGLLVLDAKGDDLVARLRQAAERVGRAEDVLVFGPRADCALDLFGGLHSSDVNRTARSVMLGIEKFGSENAYWWQSTATMLNAAFTLIIAAGRPITFASTVDFLRRWFLSPETPPELLELAHRLNLQGGDREPMLAAALDQVKMWQTLDSRTKSNLQSCLMNVLQPLLSPAAGRCFRHHSQPSSSSD